MGALNKRATVYFDQKIHKILKIKSVELSKSISELINDAVCHEFAEDQADIEAFEERATESTMSYDSMLKELKADGKI